MTGLAWRYKKTTALVAGSAYFGIKSLVDSKREESARLVENSTLLIWEISADSIFEAPPSTADQFGLSTLLSVLEKLAGAPQKITMLQALTALEMAAEDPRVRKLIVRVVPPPDSSKHSVSTGLGFAQTQELRQAILKFRAKKAEQFDSDNWNAFFHIDSFDDQLTYYLASAFRSILMQSTGSLPLTGLSSTQFHFKDLADKIGIDMQAETRKEYKSVTAPFTESSMPEKHRENIMEILSSLDSQLVSDIALDRCNSTNAKASSGESKDATADAAKQMLRYVMEEEGPFLTAKEAYDMGLISDIGQYDLFTYGRAQSNVTSLGDYGEARRREVERDSWPTLTKFEKLVDFVKQAKGDEYYKSINKLYRAYMPTNPVTVGVVYLLGGIERGGSNGAGVIAKAINDAALDPEVQSIVLRVDSGGGDVIASETILKAVEEAQELFGKPVVASYGNVSASGAYYVTASCDHILASPGTLTGSIGVATLRPVFTKRLLDFVGVNVEVLSVAGKPFSVFQELQGRQLEKYRSIVDGIYASFTSHVAKGRKLTSEQVENIARGKVFTGADALQAKLIDRLGGFTRAIEVAAQMGYQARSLTLKCATDHHMRMEIASINRQYAGATDPEMLDGKYIPVNEDPQLKEKLNDIVTKRSIIDIITHYKQELARTSDKDYKPSITENIRIKEFPVESSSKDLLYSLFSKLTGDSSSSIAEALRHGLRQAISDSIRSSSPAQQPRVETDNLDIK
ncbi:hypothetical protein GGI02_002406 [Coemansia sp. RSA 2322]|nr:hypothetical protein GGI02_002406 [Coemansia sp. RSA 2322]